MPFWQFFRNRLIGWIGHALLVQPSKTAHRIFFLFYIYFFIYSLKYANIVISSNSSFGHSDLDPSSVFKAKLCRYVHICRQIHSLNYVFSVLHKFEFSFLSLTNDVNCQLAEKQMKNYSCKNYAKPYNTALIIYEQTLVTIPFVKSNCKRSSSVDFL